MAMSGMTRDRFYVNIVLLSLLSTTRLAQYCLTFHLAQSFVNHSPCSVFVNLSSCSVFCQPLVLLSLLSTTCLAQSFLNHLSSLSGWLRKNWVFRTASSWMTKMRSDLPRRWLYGNGLLYISACITTAIHSLNISQWLAYVYGYLLVKWNNLKYRRVLLHDACGLHAWVWFLCSEKNSLLYNLE